MNFKTQICFSVALLAMFWAGSVATANAQCTYTLRMKDKFSDGWQGGQLTIRTGSDSVSYTLFKRTDSTAVLDVQSGDTLVLRWKPGVNSTEVSFQLLDNDQQVVYSVENPGFLPTVLYRGKVRCVACVRPPGVRIENVWDNRIRLRWNPGGTGPWQGWRTIVLPKGTKPGPGVGDTAVFTVPRATVTGLTEKTKYDVYVQQLCAGNLGSALVGPLSFETYWSDDVAITGIVSPSNGCTLSDTVKVLMTNFGANPQSLIRFKYSVGEMDAGVMQPQDGVYTGVLGKDSTSVVAFKTTYNFRGAGEYLITAYVETNDDDRSNDTFRYYVTNRIVPTYRQEFELWNGGWEVHTSVPTNNGRWTWTSEDYTLLQSQPEGDRAWVSRFTTATGTPQMAILESPCFDFSATPTDPHIAFSLFYKNDSFSSGGYLQASDDDGTTWKTVGSEKIGLNWYNRTNNFLKGPVWSGASSGWVIAKDTLRGMGGKSRVRLRFVHYTNGFMNPPALFAIDQVQVFLPAQRDLVALEVSASSDGLRCGLEKDSVRLTFSNFGNRTQYLYELSYNINGGPAWTESVNLDSIRPNQVITHTFEKPFDSRRGVFKITAQVAASGDQNEFNNEALLVLGNEVQETPYLEDFETAVPSGWLFDPSAALTEGHNNKSRVLAVRLSPTKKTFTHTLPAIGTIRQGDSLFFDYRIVNYNTDSLKNGTQGTTLLGNTNIEVQISTDCGNSFNTLSDIRGANHLPTANLRTRRIGLANYVGQDIVLRFRGQQVFGDFWFDTDNIVIAPNGPVSVKGPAASFAEMRVYPNPARYEARVDITMQETAPGHLELTDLTGRTLWSQRFEGDQRGLAIPLEDVPPGFYIVRLSSEGKNMLRKLIKSE